MSDDIVTRLRDIASFRGPMSGSVIPVACTEAADEIERLRKAIRHVFFNEGVCYGENCDQCELVYKVSA